MVFVNILSNGFSFLINRSQQVLIDIHVSSDAKITSGVLHGSYLGPLLFLIFIDDLQDGVKNSVCRLFAYDCFLCQRTRSPHDCDILQTDLDQLWKWESIWLMEFHTSRCHSISINIKIKPINGIYRIHSHILEQIIV